MVRLAGWITRRRDHGKLVFLDLRDASGMVQVTCHATTTKDAWTTAQEVRPEYVLRVEGKVAARPKAMVNPKLPTGEIEILATRIEILSPAAELPFPLEETAKVGEEIRLRYRYLDLRSSRMQRNIKTRDRFLTQLRRELHACGFVEIETPILTRSTPEGARDYLVPSRQRPGSFYALPQSPQQYKQLLMVAGFERYFQLARCFRDEDLRADRQPEFTQLDIEMSFVTQEDILSLTERVLYRACKAQKWQLPKPPWPRLSYATVMKRYGTEQPDLRKEKKKPYPLEPLFITDFPLFEGKEGKYWQPSHHMFTAPRPEDIPLLKTNPSKVRSLQHDLVINGVEVGGGSVRIAEAGLQREIFQLVGISAREAEEKFGHLLRAFTFGVPPHGGIALGIERLLQLGLGEKSIREVIAFPKNHIGVDPMMGTPAPVNPQQLRELGLRLASFRKVRNKKKKPR
jgi:aspartyl-tRNA synthetase